MCSILNLTRFALGTSGSVLTDEAVGPDPVHLEGPDLLNHARKHTCIDPPATSLQWSVICCFERDLIHPLYP
jgi:hypothetical protein